MSVTDSVGFGHGLYGRGPFGHGPWLTWPQTPHPGYGLSREYPVTTLRYSDGSEQRYLESATPRETLTLPFVHPDSAMVIEVASWIGLLGGGATRVVLDDPHTQQALVVRLMDESPATRLLQAGNVIELSPLTFQVERRHGLAAEIYALNPSVYYRCAEQTNVNTLIDASGNGHHAMITSGGSTGQAGMLPRDSSRSLVCRTATIPTPATGLTGALLTVHAVVQFTWPPNSYLSQPVLAWFDANSPAPNAAFRIGVDSSGHPWAIYGYQQLALASDALVDGAVHRLVYVGSGSAHSLYVDGQLVATGSSELPTDMSISSMTVGGCNLMGRYVYGACGDVALWTGTALTAAQVARLDAAARE